LDLKAYVHKVCSSIKKLSLIFEYYWIKNLIKNFVEFKKIRSTQKNNFCENNGIREHSKHIQRHQISSTLESTNLGFLKNEPLSS